MYQFSLLRTLDVVFSLAARRLRGFLRDHVEELLLRASERLHSLAGKLDHPGAALAFPSFLRLQPLKRLPACGRQQLLLHPEESLEAAPDKVCHRNCRQETADPFLYSIKDDVVFLLCQVEESALRFHEARRSFDRQFSQNVERRVLIVGLSVSSHKLPPFAALQH